MQAEIIKMSNEKTVRVSNDCYEVLSKLARYESVKRDCAVSIRQLVDEAVHLLAEELGDLSAGI